MMALVVAVVTVMLHCRGAACGCLTFGGNIRAIFSATSSLYKREFSGGPFSYLCTADTELSEK